MSSSRLRGKSLTSIAGKPLLQRVVENVKRLSFIDGICIATTSLESDLPIVSFAKHLGVECFKGSSLNVLNRFIEASSKMSSSDLILRFTADNPICINLIAEKMYKEMQGHDYLAIEKLSHIVPEFIKVGALRKMEKITNDVSDKEHVTKYFRTSLGKQTFNVKLLPNDYMGLRFDFDKYLTVDTASDLIRLENILNNSDCINLNGLYSFLEKNSLKKIETELPIVSLNGVPVGKPYMPYIIAEIGQNHNGSIDLAKKLIDMSKRCGANAVKFQKRDIESELTKKAYYAPYDNPNSFGATYGEHREFLELSYDEHKELKEYCDLVDIAYFCTPCDIPSVEFLESIGCPFYKVASRDLSNIPLLERLGELEKPVIISTGMASIEDIDLAIESLGLAKEKLIIMHCVSQYPCDMKNVNLNVIRTLENKYKLNVGLSDHTSGIIASAVATAVGAKIIEKHVTLDRCMKGTDQPGSLEEKGFYKLIEYINSIELAMGDGIKKVLPEVIPAKNKLARSLTSKTKIIKGEEVKEQDLCLKSPGHGFSWEDRSRIIGKTAKVDIPKDVTIEMSYFE
jgi:sialic acid synthase SpsE/spore coat polysaccharide biosynthesis protein SpsF (cytidylyltransferase family)